MKKKILYFILLLFTLSFSAQELKTKKEKKNALGIAIGLPGLTIDYSRKLLRKINLKLSYTALTIDDFEQEGVEIKEDMVNILANVNISIADVAFEILPFSNSSFKIVLGAGYLNEVNTNGILTYTEDVNFGNVIVSNENAGQIEADVTWSNIAPYAGIGFGRSVPKNRIGFGIEFGTYYTSSPEVNLNATKLLSPTSNQEENLKESLNTFQFIPKIQIRLAYSF